VLVKKLEPEGFVLELEGAVLGVERRVEHIAHHLDAKAY
jgi:hypothetical protein